MINNHDELIQSVQDILAYLNSVPAAKPLSPKLELESKPPEPVPVPVPPAAPEPPEPVLVPVPAPEPADFTELKQLLTSSAWPEAVPGYLICDAASESDKFDRAEGIIDFVIQPTANKKVLDFGCGEGHVVKQLVSKSGLTAAGFDIQKTGQLSWEDPSSGLLTTDWKKIVELKPFDVVLIYDVLDHCQRPVEALKQIKEVCGPETVIFCRCHPWCGPHGSHTYLTLNKSHIQLIFTEAELKKMGINLEYNQKVLFPIDTYNKWFTQAGLKVSSSNLLTEPLSNFFEQSDIIKYRLGRFYGDNFPEWQLTQAFNDYTLEIPK